MLALLAFWLAVDSTLKCNYFEWFGVAIWIRIAGKYQMSIESADAHIYPYKPRSTAANRGGATIGHAARSDCPIEWWAQAHDFTVVLFKARFVRLAAQLGEGGG